MLSITQAFVCGYFLQLRSGKMENAVIQSANQLMELVGLIIVAGLIFGKISEIIKCQT